MGDEQDGHGAHVGVLARPRPGGRRGRTGTVAACTAPRPVDRRRPAADRAVARRPAHRLRGGPHRAADAPAALARCLEQLADGGYRAALTTALPAATRRPYLANGFTVHERLHLLHPSRGADPGRRPGGHRRCAAPGGATGRQVLAVDAAAFPDVLAPRRPGPRRRARRHARAPASASRTGPATPTGGRLRRDRPGRAPRLPPAARRRPRRAARRRRAPPWWSTPCAGSGGGAPARCWSTPRRTTAARSRLYEHLGFRRAGRGARRAAAPARPGRAACAPAARLARARGGGARGRGRRGRARGRRRPRRSAARQAAAALELVAQSPGVDAGRRPSSCAVVPAGVPRQDAQLRVTVHDRVRSRSELGTSSEGDGLRRGLHTVTAPVAELPLDADGGPAASPSRSTPSIAGRARRDRARRVPGRGGRCSTAPAARSPSLVTHLVLRPPAAPSTPPLAVAVVAAVGAPPRTPTSRPRSTRPRWLRRDRPRRRARGGPRRGRHPRGHPGHACGARSRPARQRRRPSSTRSGRGRRAPVLALPYVDDLAGRARGGRAGRRARPPARPRRRDPGRRPRRRTHAGDVAGRTRTSAATASRLLPSLGVPPRAGRRPARWSGSPTACCPRPARSCSPRRGRPSAGSTGDEDDPVEALLTDGRLGDRTRRQRGAGPRRQPRAGRAGHALVRAAGHRARRRRAGRPPRSTGTPSRAVLDGLRAASALPAGGPRRRVRRRRAAARRGRRPAAPRPRPGRAGGHHATPSPTTSASSRGPPASVEEMVGADGRHRRRRSTPTCCGPPPPSSTTAERRAELDAAQRRRRRPGRRHRDARDGHHHPHRPRGHRAADDPQRQRWPGATSGPAAQPEARAARRATRSTLTLAEAHDPARHPRAHPGLGQLPLRRRGHIARRRAWRWRRPATRCAPRPCRASGWCSRSAPGSSSSSGGHATGGSTGAAPSWSPPTGRTARLRRRPRSTRCGAHTSSSGSATTPWPSASSPTAAAT